MGLGAWSMELGVSNQHQQSAGIDRLRTEDSQQSAIGSRQGLKTEDWRLCTVDCGLWTVD